MIRVYFLLVIFFLQQSLYSQITIKEIIINTEEEDCLKYQTLKNENSDTANIYLIFENGFSNVELRAYCNRNIILIDTISTDQSLGMSKVVKVGLVEDVQNMSFKLNEANVITLPKIKGKFYVQVNYINEMGVLLVCYTKFMSFYQ